MIFNVLQILDLYLMLNWVDRKSRDTYSVDSFFFAEYIVESSDDSDTFNWYNTIEYIM